MRARCLIALALAGATLPALAADFPVVTFRAPMEHVREAKTLIVEQGFGPEEEVEVAERAVVFTPPLAIRDIRTAPQQQHAELDFLLAYLQANISGSPEQMAQFWLPAERVARLKEMRDPDKLRAVRAFFTRFPGINVVAMVQQETTTTIYLARGGVLQGIHVKRDPDRFFLTGAPDNDIALAVVEGALMAGSYQ